MYKVPKNLLSKGSTNAKTAKNELVTFILYLAPHKQNSFGINVCPKASEGCAAACLYTAGRGKFSNVQQSRVNKTEYYLNDKVEFIKQLSNEIVREVKKARNKGYKVAFRLNGTSDLDFVGQLKKHGTDIADFSDVAIFYDYTKILGKAIKYLDHPNYVLTFSRAEDNVSDSLSALSKGVNVAAVFSGDLPDTHNGYKVVDGDKSDIVMLEHSGVILGLRAKGDAKKDTSGFVIKNY